MPISPAVVSWRAPWMCCAACTAVLRCGCGEARRGERAVPAGRRAAGGAGSGRVGGGSWPGP
eukprot:5783859-Prymnesium_polylepis.1